MSFTWPVIEEIGLEGLDGITLPSLWLRLEARKPTFPLNLDDKTKQYLWNTVLSCHHELEFFVLPEPRPVIHIRYRHDSVDPDTGMFNEQDFPDDFNYPTLVIKFPTADVAGSCPTFYTRTNVTAEIRGLICKNKMSMDEAVKKWGDSLVVVASQKVRNKILFDSNMEDIHCKMGEQAYCALERVGRSRYEGELTQGRNSLATALDVSSKTIFYLKKKVFKPFNVVTHQHFVQRTLKNQSTSTTLLHLKKFAVKIRPAYLQFLDRLSMLLLSKPNSQEIMAAVRSDLNVSESKFKKLLGALKTYVKPMMVPYCEVRPDDTANFFNKTTKKKTLRHVKVVRLVQPYNGEMEEGMDEQSDEEDNDDEGGSPNELLMTPYTPVADRSVLEQALDMLKQQGEHGLSIRQMGYILKISSLDARQICRTLEKIGLAKSFLWDKFKQREQRFVLARTMEKSAIHKFVEKDSHKCFNATPPRPQPNPTTVNKVTPPPQPASLREESVGTTEGGEAQKNIPPQLPKSEPINPFSNPDMPANQTAQPKRDAHVTYRMVRRANIVIQMVKETRVITDPLYIKKEILKQEEEEGLAHQIDKKSLHRLLNRLEKTGQIKQLRKTVRLEEEDEGVCQKNEKTMHIIMAPDVDEDDRQVLGAIDSFRLQLCHLNKEATAKVRQRKNNKGFVTRDHLLQSSISVTDMVYDSEAGRRYGYQPRMRRIQIVHEFLWYVSHGESGYTDNCPEVKFPPTQENVFCDEQSWKRFVPPIPKHAGYPAGWCLLGDALIVLPVSLFCQVIRVNFKIPGLEELLNDPIQRNLLMCQIPQNMRQQLMFERKYLFAFDRNCLQLAQMGLLTFGKRTFKEKNQVFVYLHQLGRICNSVVGKTDWPVEQFIFNKLSDVEEYWLKLQYVCINTPLENVYIHAAGRNKQSLDVESFEACVKECSVENVSDTGEQPGDGRGAGGLDSTFFSHLTRNWKTVTDLPLINKLGPSKIQAPRKRTKATGTASTTGTTKKSSKRKRPKQSAKNTLEEKAKEENQEPEAELQEEVDEAEEEVFKLTPARKRKRKFAPITGPAPPRPVRKRYVSFEDQRALEFKTKERVIWTDSEDCLLLVCQVAHKFMFGRRRDFVIPYSTIRDIIHERYEVSKDKTSISCSRRIKYMMKNPATVHNVELNLREATLDKELVKEFLPDGKYFTKTKDLPLSEVIKQYKKLIAKLQYKISKQDSEEEWCILPSSHAELRDHCSVCTLAPSKVVRHRNPTCTEDITDGVLHNLIHATMILSDKTGRSQQLFRLFSKYPEEALNRVFTVMKSDRLITKVKRTMLAAKTSTVGSYQPSQRYAYMLMSHYPRTMFQEAAKTLLHLQKKPANDSERYDDAAIHYDSLTLEDSSSHAVLTVSLMATKQAAFFISIPDQVVLIDSDVLDAPEKFNCRMEPDEDDSSGSESDTNEKDVVPGYRAIPPGTGTRAMNFLVRCHYIHSQSVRNLNPNDFLVVNPCKITLSIDHRPAAASSSLEEVSFREVQSWNKEASKLTIHPASTPLILREMRTLQPAIIRVNDAMTEIQQKYYPGSSHMLAIRNVHDIVDQAGEMGLNTAMLKEKCADYANELQGYIDVMIKYHMVLRVGVVEPLFVSHKFCYHWLIHSYKNLKGRPVKSFLEEDEDLIDQAHLDSLQRAVACRRSWPQTSPGNSNPGNQQRLTEGKPVKRRAGDLQDVVPGKRPRITFENPEKEDKECASGDPVQQREPHSSQESTGISMNVADETVQPIVENQITSLSSALDNTISVLTEVDLNKSGGEDKDCDKADKTDKISDDNDTPAEALHFPSVSKTAEQSGPSSSCNHDNSRDVCKDAGLHLTEQPTNTPSNNISSETADSAPHSVPTVSSEPGCTVSQAGTAAASTSVETAADADISEVTPPQHSKHPQRKRKRKLPSGSGSTQPTYQPVRLVCRPWRTPEGSVNRQALQLMLEAVCMKLMCMPGVTLEYLSNVMSPVLQPVPLLELIEILEQLGCVTRQSVPKIRKASLFSQRSLSQSESSTQGTDQLVETFSATTDCIIKLGLFVNDLQQRKFYHKPTQH